MPKSSRRSRRANTDRSATTDIVTQLECAVRRPQATLIGALVGGIVPWFARTLAHGEVPAAWSRGSHGLALVMIAVVLGCACFSAITVYKFGKATFNDTRKALGFVLAIEGVMLVSTGTTSAVALAVLIAINALSNGSSIALARDATCKRRESAARSAATRARKRAPIAVEVETTAPAAGRSVRAPRAVRPHPVAMVKVPRWDVPHSDDIIEAEIVSEERLLS